MSTLAAYPGMMQRARKREGIRICRAAWLVGVSVREYREIEAGDREPSPGMYERISELYGWPQTFVGQSRTAANRVPGSGPTSQADRHSLPHSPADPIRPGLLGWRTEGLGDPHWKRTWFAASPKRRTAPMTR